MGEKGIQYVIVINILKTELRKIEIRDAVSWMADGCKYVYMRK